MKKDAKVVVQRNRERAEAGDKWAQTKLGMRYLEGDGVERNDVEAKRWLRLAAEQGSQPAAKALEGIGLRAPSAPAQTAEAEMERGLQLTFRGEHDEAAEAFRHCMEIDKADPAPAYNLACSYAMQGIVEWAVQNLTEAVERGMSYAELMQDPDRGEIFGADPQGRYEKFWVWAEQRSREKRLRERDAKAAARRAAHAEAELRAAEQIEAETDHEAVARAAADKAEQADGTYKMKGLGVRSLLYDTVRAFHEAERLLDRALRSDALPTEAKRSLDQLHAQVGRRFDVLCTKAASMKEGAAELEKTLDEQDAELLAAERSVVEERAAEIMSEWDNDWEVAKLKQRIGLEPVEDDDPAIDFVDSARGGDAEESAAGAGDGGAASGAEPGLGMTTSTFASGASRGSTRAGSSRAGHGEQLAYELALGEAVALGKGAGGEALREAESMLMQRAAGATARDDPVVGYRWYRLCLVYAELGDEEGACRAFHAAVQGGLHKVGVYGETHTFRPEQHPALARMSAGGGEMFRLLEAFARTQVESEAVAKTAYQRRQAKSTGRAVVDDLLSEGVSIHRAGEAAEEVRAMHMRRSGNLGGLVDPAELSDAADPVLRAPPAAAAAAAVAGGGGSQPSGADALAPAPAPLLPAAPGPVDMGFQTATAPAPAPAPIAAAPIAAGAQDEMLARDPGMWSVEQVGRWLESLKLPMHVEIFAQQVVDGETLLSLTGAEIEGTLGVTKLGHVKVLTKGILALRSRAANAY